MDEVEKLISSAPCKTCELDPPPTCLIKDVKQLLSPFSIHRAAVQQVTDFRLFPPTTSKRSSRSAAEERRFGHRPDEELQTGLEFVLSFQAFGERQ